MIGTTIDGKYRIRSKLGEGGMGAVFEAEHRALGRTVAIKVLHPARATRPVAVKRFEQEARAAGTIGHPNICEVYDLGTLKDGSPYLVMERLVGETLAERIARDGGLPFLHVIDILSAVLSALTAAHEKGIVHRDIKPDNVFLAERAGAGPVVKLLDFGISKFTFQGIDTDELELTRTGFVMGSPFYMSPEQARGDRDLDARVDIYGCGVVMYEMVTGRLPFNAPNYNALLVQIASVEPPPARKFRDVPSGFERVIQKAMERDRDERYPTATAFRRDLAKLIDDAPTTEIALRAIARPRASSVSSASRAVHASRRAKRATPLAGTPTPTGAPAFDGKATRPGPPPSSARKSKAHPSAAKNSEEDDEAELTQVGPPSKSTRPPPRPAVRTPSESRAASAAARSKRTPSKVQLPPRVATPEEPDPQDAVDPNEEATQIDSPEHARNRMK